MKKVIILFFLVVHQLYSTTIAEQLLEDSNYIVPGANGVGQSFFIASDVTLVSIEIASNDTSGSGLLNLSIFDAATNCTAANRGNGDSIHEQNNIAVPDTYIMPGYTFTTATLSTPLALTGGSTYQFCFFDSGGGGIELAFQSADVYAGGSVFNNGGADPAVDLTFRLNGLTTGTAPLSKNALILLFLGFLTIGMYGLRSQKA